MPKLAYHKPEMDEYLDITTAAERFGCAATTLRDKIVAGGFGEGAKKIKGHWMVGVNAIRKWLLKKH
jgi:hypothetical protein